MPFSSIPVEPIGKNIVETIERSRDTTNPLDWTDFITVDIDVKQHQSTLKINATVLAILQENAMGFRFYILEPNGANKVTGNYYQHDMNWDTNAIGIEGTTAEISQIVSLTSLAQVTNKGIHTVKLQFACSKTTGKAWLGEPYNIYTFRHCLIVEEII